MHVSLYYSITKVFALNTIIELPRLHIPHLRYLKQLVVIKDYESAFDAITLIQIVREWSLEHVFLD